MHDSAQWIIASASIITTWLTVKYAPYFRAKFLGNPDEKNSFSPIYGYEKLVKDLQKDLDRARDTNDKQRSQIETMQERITTLADQLAATRQSNQQLAKYNKELVRRLSKYETVAENGF